MSFGLTKALSKHGGRIIERWMFDAKAPLVSPATTADLFRNGKQYILFGTKDGQVHCVDESGKEVWAFSPEDKLSAVESFFVDQERVYSIDAAPTVMDINADGKNEVLFGSERGMIYCLSADGKLLWKHDCGGSIKAGCLVEDVNMDGRLEILVGSSNNKLSVLTNKGEKLFEYITDSPVESVPGVLKGKKIMIVFGNNKGVLSAITPAQDLIWRIDLGSRITAKPVFFHDSEEHRMVIGTIGGALHCISEHGEMVWVYKTRGSIYSAAAVHDINEDNKPEIIFGSCDNNVYALSADGQRLWNYETDFWITSTPLIADIDDDGKLEVVIGSYDHNVYILDSKGSYVLEYVPGLSDIVNQAGHYAGILTSEPGEQTGKKLYQYRMSGIIVGCALITQGNKTAIIVNVKSGTVSNITHEN